MQIHHMPGTENKIADALSRTPVMETNKCVMISSATLNSKESITRDLKIDEEFGNLYNYSLNPDEYISQAEDILRNRAQHYEIIAELLFYKKQLNTFGELRPIIPFLLLVDIIEEFHDLPIAAHPDIRKTFTKLSGSVFWPNMRKYVIDYVKTFSTCQRHNYVSKKLAGLRHNITAIFQIKL